MKKLITLTCLLGAFVFNARAETITLLAVKPGDAQSFTIEEGQVAHCLSFIHNWSNRKGNLRIWIQDKYIDLRPGYFDGGKLPVISGPAKIQLTANSDHATMATFKIKNDLGGDDGNNVTVLPKETENMELILESSDDMVKWEKDVIGDKPKANRKKFYRLRAVKK